MLSFVTSLLPPLEYLLPRCNLQPAWISETFNSVGVILRKRDIFTSGAFTNRQAHAFPVFSFTGSDAGLRAFLHFSVLHRAPI